MGVFAKMKRLSDYLTYNDIKILSKILVPNYKETEKLYKTIREDEEILRKMLSDSRLFTYIMKNPKSYMEISPTLLFAILLRHMRNELINHPYTFENNDGDHIVVFDAKDIINLLEKEEALDYLTELLVSFTRIHSFSTIYRIRKGTWRRLKFSDFDIDSLIRFSRTLDENLRFRPFKKVADICLFILGIFPEYVEKHEWPLSFGDRRLASHPKVKKIGFENYGSYYYQKASNMETAYTLGLHDILNYFAENFKIAEKTLNYITDKYLVFHDKKKLFPI